MNSSLSIHHPIQVHSNSPAENKFKPGDIVCERIHPHQKLIVRRFFNRIYYCKVQEDINRKELAFFERELKPEDSILEKNKIA